MLSDFWFIVAMLGFLGRVIREGLGFGLALLLG
jgi:hypothetical protein